MLGLSIDTEKPHQEDPCLLGTATIHCSRLLVSIQKSQRGTTNAAANEPEFEHLPIETPPGTNNHEKLHGVKW